MESASQPVIAATLFDSQKQPSLGGTRGAGDARHLVLRAEGFDIHVKAWGIAPTRQMTGQILSRGAALPVADARLHLMRDGERLAITSADKFGGFTFYNVPEGQLSLQIDMPNLTVVGALNLDN